MLILADCHVLQRNGRYNVNDTSVQAALGNTGCCEQM